MMKFKSSPDKQSIIYRLCDTVNCRSIATNVTKDMIEVERQLCDQHKRQLQIELKEMKRELNANS